MTNKLTNSSPLLEIVNTINKLIDDSNDTTLILDSFRNEDNLTDDIYSYGQINQGYVIKIKTTGIYEISLDTNNGVADILINSRGDTASFRHKLGQEPVEILLCNGDEVMLTGNVDEGDIVRFKVKKTIIQAFVEKTEMLEQAAEILQNTQKAISEYQLVREDFNTQVELLEHSMRVIVDTQRDIQNLSARVSQLEG